MPNIGPPPDGRKPDDAPVTTPESPPPLPSLRDLPQWQQDATKAAREALAVRARAREGIDATPTGTLRADLALARASASVAGTPRPAGLVAIATALPPAVAAAARLPVTSPRVWSRDLRPLRGRLDAEGWLTAVRAAVSSRAKGDVLAPALVRVAELLVWGARRQGTGYARMTFRGLARLAGCCGETVRKVVRWLEARGLLDTFNVLQRGPHWVRREANLYLLRGAHQAEASSDQAPSRAARWASAFGLFVSAWGLNAGPRATRGTAGQEPDS